MYIVSEQALFRAASWYWPTEIWNVAAQEWRPYTGKVPKPEGGATSSATPRLKSGKYPDLTVPEPEVFPSDRPWPNGGGRIVPHPTLGRAFPP